MKDLSYRYEAISNAFLFGSVSVAWLALSFFMGNIITFFALIVGVILAMVLLWGSEIYLNKSEQENNAKNDTDQGSSPPA